MKKSSSFPSFRSQHNGQNRNLGNIANSKFPQIKEIHSNLDFLKNFPSFLSYWFQYKDQNWKLENLRNFLLPSIKQLEALKNVRLFRLSIWVQGPKSKTQKPHKFPSSSNKAITSLEKISEFSKSLISVQGPKLKIQKPHKFPIFFNKTITSLEKFPSFPSFWFQ